MEIESLELLPEDLEDLILKAIMKALERLYKEGLKWLQENQDKKVKKKSKGFK